MSRTRYVIVPGDESPNFLTLTTVSFPPVFGDPIIAQFILDSLLFLTKTGDLILFAYVIMENHIHVIVSSANLRAALNRFKSYTARRCIDYLVEKGRISVLKQLESGGYPKRPGRRYQFWQEGSFPKQIQSETMMLQIITYIHFNPVRRGYVDLPEHWRYSSARNYSEINGLIEVSREW